MIKTATVTTFWYVCDREKCMMGTAPAPSNIEATLSARLAGWEITKGGKHYCPMHRTYEESKP